MATLKNLDLNAWFADFSSQFQNLNMHCLLYTSDAADE